MMRRFLIVCFAMIFVLAACDNEPSAPVAVQDTIPAGVDTSAMVKPLPVDSQHLHKTAMPLPDTGSMPVVHSSGKVVSE